jgi:hypothetical protein
MTPERPCLSIPTRVCAPDCCPQCDDLADTYQPQDAVSDDGGYVRLAYRCRSGHGWTSNWLKSFIGWPRGPGLEDEADELEAIAGGTR